MTSLGNYTARPCDDALRAALTNKGLRYVGLRGDPKSKVWVVGEAPGADEDRLGFPFVGFSGQLLDQMLREAGFKNDETCFSNPYKSRPPDNDIKRIEELGVPVNLFTDQFFEELRLYKPTIIIACGKTPANLLCPETKPKAYKGKEDEKEGFGSWRGSLLISPFLDFEHYVIPMYHPAFVLRNYSEREICIFILIRAFEEFQYYLKNTKLRPLPQRTLITNPSFGIAYDFLRWCINSPDHISIDIELLRRKVPYTISFAPSPSEAISLSFWNYPSNQCIVLWRMMDEVLSKCLIVGQNFTSFDAHWLRAMGFNVNLANVEDTLILHHILWPGLRHKLEFLGMQYTRQPFWKWEGRSWSLKDGLEQLMHYNALDAACTYEIYLRMMEELRDQV